MSAREWKPGDVAAIPFADGDEVCLYVEGGWITPRLFTSPICNFTDARPLVVLDPEDREQVERLALLIRDAESGDWIDDTQAALREFANPTPPKPAEPTGLGAVVEDAEGVRYVLTHGNSGQPVWVDRFSEWEYDKIAVVRVLSEGWSE